jgi:hypothetical protein
MTRANGALHRLVWSMTAPDALFFRRNARSATRIQHELLAGILKANRETRFGKENGFDRVRTSLEYRERVLVRGWEQFLPYIHAIRTGTERVLTAEAVRLFEPTSGSASAVKLIPYTEGLRRQYGRGVNVWLHDVYKHVPGVRGGKHFWSISSSHGAQADFDTSLRVGFDSDAAYLGLCGQLLSRLFAIPASVKLPADMEQSFRTVARCLLRAGDLTLISVWSPSYLTSVLDSCLTEAPQVSHELTKGKTSDQERATCLATAWKRWEKDRDMTRLVRAWWPDLALVSAWADGASAAGAAMLKRTFPEAVFQQKGLLATEGIVTIPLWPDEGVGEPFKVPAYTSHFYEFLPEGERSGARAVTLGELEPGCRYTVVLTTAGGLYRYLLNDLVRVSGRWMGLPTLDFLARVSCCDLVGEKLSELFCLSVLQRLFPDGQKPDLAFFAPLKSADAWGYGLFLQKRGLKPRTAVELAGRAEMLLRENYHYGLARSLGQLVPLRLFRIRGGGWDDFHRRLVGEGIKLGNIKSPVVDRRQNWNLFLQGRFVDA